MAKITVLEAVNKVLKNIGETGTLTVLTALTPIQLLAFDKLNEAIMDIATDQNYKWKFLEKSGRVALATGTSTYVVTSLTTGTDAIRFDLESFRSVDSGQNLNFLIPQEFDATYPAGIGTTNTGYPQNFTEFEGAIAFDSSVGASINGKYINFRYWKRPTLFSTTTTTGTVDIPEEFQLSVLINMATEKVLAYLQNEEAKYYHLEVYGDGAEKEGSFAKMKENLMSPELKPRFTYVL